MCQYIRKNKSIIVLIIVVLLIPLFLHLGYNYFQIIPTIEELSSSTWLLFFGSYLGGVATLIAVFISTKKANEANRKMIERQWKEKKYIEFKQVLLSNLDLTNLPDLGNLINLSFENLTEKRNSIAQKRTDIYKCDIAFRVTSSIEIENKEHLKEELNYYKCWTCLINKMSIVLDLQAKAIELAQSSINNNKDLDLRRQMESNLKEIIELLKKTEDPYEDKETQLADVRDNIVQLQTKVDDFRSEFSNHLEKIVDAHSEFRVCVHNQYQLTSILLIAKEYQLK